MDFSQMDPSDWAAIYGASLSSLIVLVAVTKWAIKKIRVRAERAKFETDLYFLRKIDTNTKEIYPIVVVLLANLGSERISLKSLEYEGNQKTVLEQRAVWDGMNSLRSYLEYETGCYLLFWKVEKPQISQ